MKIMITGAAGQLGSEFCEQLRAGESVLGEIPARYKDCELLPLSSAHLNIADEIAVMRMLLREKPNMVINCAAFTNVDACESDERAAYAVNAQGAEYLARGCAQVGARMVHISTDYVFDGRAKEPYTEDAVCNPISVYGKSKRAGERLVEAHCPHSIVVRTAWLYGAAGGNFVHTILRLASERERIQVVNDQIGCPTNAVDFVRTVLHIAALRPVGTYHVTGNGVCSWYDFATEIVRLSGLPCQVEPCTTQEFPRPAPRPAYSVLAHENLRALMEDPMRDWKDALADFMIEINKKGRT